MLPFISVQDLSDMLGRPLGADPGALAAVDAACDVCREIANQDFNYLATDTVRIDGTGSDAILLPQRPVVAAGTVLVNGVAETAYEVTPEGMLFRGSAGGGLGSWGGWSRPVWPRGRLNVQVTYDHGFGTVPSSVRLVALNIARRTVVQGAAISEGVGAVNVRYSVSAGDLDKNELRILQGYRSPRS